MVRENLTRAMDDVFKTMLRQTVRPVAGEGGACPSGDWPGTSATPGQPQVVGSVGFIGEANGAVYLWFDEVLAGLCTAAMLGLSEAELAEMGEEPVNDAVGELANMVVGSFKNALCDAGFPCKLTIPAILRGTDCHLAPTHHNRRFNYSFESAGRRVAVDVLLKAKH